MIQHIPIGFAIVVYIILAVLAICDWISPKQLLICCPLVVAVQVVLGIALGVY